MSKSATSHSVIFKNNKASYFQVICIYAEYKKVKHQSIFSAFRVTTQKLLLGIVIAASSVRVLYFSLQVWHVDDAFLDCIVSLTFVYLK